MDKILKKSLLSLNLDYEDKIVESLIKSCSFNNKGFDYIDLDLFLESSRLSFDSKDISFIDMQFWFTFCENRDLVSWNGFCKRFYNNFKTKYGKTDVMKALLLLERWKEDDKLIRRCKYELFAQALQTSLYVFEKKGLSIELETIWKVNKVKEYKIESNNEKLKNKERDSSNKKNKKSSNRNHSKDKEKELMNLYIDDHSNKMKKSNSNKNLKDKDKIKNNGVNIPKLNLKGLNGNEDNDRKQIQSKSFIENKNDVDSSKSNNNSLNKSFCDDKNNKNKKNISLKVNLKNNALKDKQNTKVINCKTPDITTKNKTFSLNTNHLNSNKSENNLIDLNKTLNYKNNANELYNKMNKIIIN